jgi:hypothetical protein
MTILSGGNIGIGTTNIFNPLTVEAGSSSGINQGLVINSAHAFGAGQGTAASALVFSRNRTAIDVSVLQPAAQIVGGNESETTSGYGYMAFYTTDASSALPERMRINSNGNVGIGTTNPAYKLDVPNGTIHAGEVIVDTSGADYVFKPDYRLASLSEVEKAIKRDGHLPDIPSAQEMSSHGMSVGDLQAKLLAKVEELTLHQIEQEKRIDRLEKENTELREKLNP